VKPNDITAWPKIVAFVTIFAVAANLVFSGADHMPLLLAGLVLFVVIYPVWPWSLALSSEFQFGLVLADASLVTAGLFGSGRPGTVVILFFVLIPTCGRLPRQYSLLCYVLIPLLACLPFIFRPSGPGDWASVLTLISAFLALAVFTEAYTQVRYKAQENQKLLDELVAAQKLLNPSESGSLPAVGMKVGDQEKLALTRREKEVLSLLAMGFTNKEIAERLFLAEGTVKNRVSAILEKTNMHDRTQAALRARELGII